MIPNAEQNLARPASSEECGERRGNKLCLHGRNRPQGGPELIASSTTGENRGGEHGDQATRTYSFSSLRTFPCLLCSLILFTFSFSTPLVKNAPVARDTYTSNAPPSLVLPPPQNLYVQ